VYNLEKTPGGLRAIRQGDLEVVPPDYKDGDQLPTRIIQESSNIRSQFQNNLLKAEFVHDGLTLSGDWEKAGKLPLVDLSAAEGWLRLGWKRP
jgi:hypothetical protein